TNSGARSARSRNKGQRPRMTRRVPTSPWCQAVDGTAARVELEARDPAVRPDRRTGAAQPTRARVSRVPPMGSGAETKMEWLSIFERSNDYRARERDGTRLRRRVMPQYLVCNYLPDDFDPSTVTEEMIEGIHALNRELIAAGVRKFACGISPAANAK